MNKLLLSEDKFMPEMHLRQPAALDKSGFIYSSFGPFTKNKERIQKIKKTEDSQYIYKNELDKACFQYDMAYGDFKDLTRRTASDCIFRLHTASEQILHDKASIIAKNLKYDGYQRGLASVVYQYFDKKASGSGIEN